MPQSLVDTIRVAEEARLGEYLLREHAWKRYPQTDRELFLESAVRLDLRRVPTIARALHRATEELDFEGPVELFVAEPRLDAYGYAVQAMVAPPSEEDPVTRITYWPRTIRLGTASQHAYILGHELGHIVAGHSVPGESTPQVIAKSVAHSGLPHEIRNIGFRALMAGEMTADRCGLIAAGSLEALVRVMMSVLIGCDSEEVPVEPRTLLTQARERVEESEEGPLLGTTHPSEMMRLYAAELFWRSSKLHALTGLGTGELSDEELERRTTKLLRRADARYTQERYRRDAQRNPLRVTVPELPAPPSPPSPAPQKGPRGGPRGGPSKGRRAPTLDEALDALEPAITSLAEATREVESKMKGATDWVKEKVGRRKPSPAQRPRVAPLHDEEDEIDPYKEYLLERFRELEERQKGK